MIYIFEILYIFWYNWCLCQGFMIYQLIDNEKQSKNSIQRGFCSKRKNKTGLESHRPG